VRRRKPVGDIMTVILNKLAYEQARKLIANHRYVLDDAALWTDHRPSRTAQKLMIERDGLAEFGRWHLGIDDEIEEDSKLRFKFPYGDFLNVHRCAVLAAEARAGQGRYGDIEAAAAHLHGMLDASLEPQKQATEPRGRLPIA
jgi:hypothetical protein